MSLSRCIWYARARERARFGAGGHTFNFARPITKSDMHHSEINSQQQQQRAHVLFVMSRSNSPERGVAGRRRGRERGRRKRERGGQRGKWALPWWQVVVISRVSSQLMTTPGARICPAYPMYISCLSALSHHLRRPSFVFFVRGDFERYRAFNRYGNERGSSSVDLHFSNKQFNTIILWSFIIVHTILLL